MQRNYWVAVICGAAILTIGIGTRQSFGIFLRPIAAEFGDVRELWSFGTSLAMLLMGACSPFVGNIADRFGAARTVAGGGALYVAGMLVIWLATDGVMLTLGNALTGIGLAAAGFGPQSTGEALREASLTPGFWLLTIGFFVCGFHVAFVGLHLPAYIADEGVGLEIFGYTLAPAELGGWAIGLVGLFNIAGAIMWGWLGGRHRRKDMLAILYLLRAGVFVAFLILPLSAFSVLGFAAALGFLWLGTIPLTSGLVGYIFGPAFMSMLYGIVFFSHQLGSFLGGWGGGRLYDLTQSYDAMWWISVALGLTAALLNLLIREQPVARLAPAAAE